MLQLLDQILISQTRKNRQTQYYQGNQKDIFPPPEIDQHSLPFRRESLHRLALKVYRMDRSVRFSLVLMHSSSANL